MTDLPTPDDALAYATDACQRAVLFMDVMRQRSQQAAAHNAETVPHVLSLRPIWSVTGATCRDR